MEVLRSFAVRLYQTDLEAAAGAVESVGTGEIASFRSPEELWAALQRVPSRRRSPSANLFRESDA